MFNNRKKMWIVLVSLLIVSIFIGNGLGNYFFNSASMTKQGVSSNQTWTCAMHPQIRKDGQGKCPVCAMSLVPVQFEEPTRKERTIKYW